MSDPADRAVLRLETTAAKDFLEALNRPAEVNERLLSALEVPVEAVDWLD